MSRFWQSVCAILFFFVVAVCLFPRQLRGDVPSLALRWAGLALCSIPMGVAWAICFRKQVEQLRPSLFSLFVLMAMQAALVWYATLMNPGWFSGR